MNCPTCKTKMKLKTDLQLNEKYYDCGNCAFNVLRSIAKMKIDKATAKIIKYS